jgi:hypothetical protein
MGETRDKQLRAAKAKLRQVRQELRDVHLSAMGELTILNARLQVLLPVYWAAKALAEKNGRHVQEWAGLEAQLKKALRAAQKVLG